MPNINIPITSLAGAIPMGDGSGYRFVVQFLDNTGALINNANLTQNQTFVRTNITPTFELSCAIAAGNYTIPSVTVRVHSDSTGSGKYQDRITNIVVNCGYSLSITNISKTVELANPPQAAPQCFFAVNLLEPNSFRGPKNFTLKMFQNGNLLNGPNGYAITGLDTQAYPAIIFDPKNSMWALNGPGTYNVQVSTVYNNVTYQDTEQIMLVSDDFTCGTDTRPGVSDIVLEDYLVSGNQVSLTLSGGDVQDTITVELRQSGVPVGILTASYASVMTITSSGYGYADVYVGNTDIGSAYIPQQISGAWTVQQAKAVDETGFMNLQFNKVGNQFVVTDAVTGGYTNVEYWHGKDYLGATIPTNYAVEPNVDHHITKKGWSSGSWIGGYDDGINRAKAQLTFKIVSA